MGSLARAATGVARGGNDGAASYASYTTVIAAPDVAVGISGFGVRGSRRELVRLDATYGTVPRKVARTEN